ncbi:uncharacterized protein [Coffea arabica]|uniref:Uncharacterized protein n=1 Tax=Coffea arabica TaxID=13443 RepID=A0A6P6T7B4_COFAR|nr:uncharacterized protein LOC113698457 isoform X1 [Coffea arabica]
MTVIYDNWERLVRATLRREDLRLSGQRTPSSVSSVSGSSSFNFGFSSSPVSSFNILSLLVGDSFSYDQILQATNRLDDSNLIKLGSHGKFIYGVLEDGTQILVKKIDLSDKTESCFMSELENFGKVCHSSFTLLGHCLENGKDKFLVYKYLPHRGLSRSLYRKIDLNDRIHLPPLDWKRRLMVAVNTLQKKIVSNTDKHSPMLDSKVKWKIVVKISSGAAEGLYNAHHVFVPHFFDGSVLDSNYEVQLGRHSDIHTEVNDSWNRIAMLQQLPKYQIIRLHERNFGENSKWLEIVEEVDLVLFSVSLTDYDEFYVDSEGCRINKMLASRKLMENVVTHPTFANKNFLLVLDKFDLFEKKVGQAPLTRCDWFQDFNIEVLPCSSASVGQYAFHYIAVKFKRLFDSITTGKLYVSPVTVLGADSVEEALKYGREIIKWEEEKFTVDYSDDEWSSSSF